MSSLEIPRPVVIENDPQDLRIDEYNDGAVYRWNTDRELDSVLEKAQDFNLSGPVVTDSASYPTTVEAVEMNAADEASNFLVVYGQDSSVSWERSDGEYLAEIGVVEEKNAGTDLVDDVYRATTGEGLDSVTTGEITELLDPAE
jgi:hypothetical protein